MAEAIKQHDDAQGEDGIHCTILEILVLLDAVDIAHSQLPNHKCAEAISDEDEGN